MFMPDGEKKLVKCTGCGDSYDTANLKPGADFKCRKCGAVNTWPLGAVTHPAHSQKPAGKLRTCLGCHKQTAPSEIIMISGQPLCHECRGRLVKFQQAAGRNLRNGLLGGLAAAIVSGFIWSILEIFTFSAGKNNALSFLVIMIGVIVGWVVFLAADRKRSKILQLIAFGATILGIIIGKYIAAYYILNHADRGGFPFFSSNTLHFFYGIVLQGLVNGYDIICISLALFAAYKIPVIGRVARLTDAKKENVPVPDNQ